MKSMPFSVTEHKPMTENLTPERRAELIDSQCALAGHFMFAPESGRCWSCGRDIVDESWAVVRITGCKFCNRSYVD
jgi:hypothetical protein